MNFHDDAITIGDDIVYVAFTRPDGSAARQAVRWPAGHPDPVESAIKAMAVWADEHGVDIRGYPRHVVEGKLFP